MLMTAIFQSIANLWSERPDLHGHGPASKAGGLLVTRRPDTMLEPPEGFEPSPSRVQAGRPAVGPRRLELGRSGWTRTSILRLMRPLLYHLRLLTVHISELPEKRSRLLPLYDQMRFNLLKEKENVALSIDLPTPARLYVLCAAFLPSLFDNRSAGRDFPAPYDKGETRVYDSQIRRLILTIPAASRVSTDDAFTIDGTSKPRRLSVGHLPCAKGFQPRAHRRVTTMGCAPPPAAETYRAILAGPGGFAPPPNGLEPFMLLLHHGPANYLTGTCLIRWWGLARPTASAHSPGTGT